MKRIYFLVFCLAIGALACVAVGDMLDSVLLRLLALVLFVFIGVVVLIFKYEEQRQADKPHDGMPPFPNEAEAENSPKNTEN